MILPIVQVWEKILIQVATPVEDIGEIKALIGDMKDTLSATWWGVGLAAPQVWVWLRVFVMHPRPTQNYPDEQDQWVQVIINPHILNSSTIVVSWYEWCLSISSQNGQGMLRAQVPRHERIEVTYMDENWNEYTKKLDWFAAIIFQHEYDHLEWMVFLERVENWSSLRSSK
jgi:peptide deformylase